MSIIFFRLLISALTNKLHFDKNTCQKMLLFQSLRRFFKRILGKNSQIILAWNIIENPNLSKLNKY
jgi:hypothetical protein